MRNLHPRVLRHPSFSSFARNIHRVMGKGRTVSEALKNSIDAYTEAIPSNILVSLSSNITSTPHVSAQQVVRGKLRDEKVFKPFDAQGPLPPEWYYVEHKQAGEGDKYYLNLALDVWCEERPTDLTNESSPGVRPANQSNPQKPVTQISPITSTQPKSSSELTWLSIRTGFSCGNERGNYKDAKLQSGASR